MRHYVMSSVFVILAGSAAADIPLVRHDLNDYGFVWDLNLGRDGDTPPSDADCLLNDQSCVPTSWTNCLVYIQNTYGTELAGLEIAGSDYSAWTETVETLRSSEFMNTLPHDPGTIAYGQLHGLEKFLMQQGAGPLATSYLAIGNSDMLNNLPPPPGKHYPEWLMRGAPELYQLESWLKSGAAVVIDVLYEWQDGDLYNNGEPVPQDLWGTPNGNGHALALVGVKWDDLNSNKTVDRGEAYLDVIDPLNPTFGNYTDDNWHPVGPAQYTQIEVWQTTDWLAPSNVDVINTFGLLNMEYDQTNSNYCQPYDSATHTASGWLGGAGALNIIGGPGGSCCLVTGCDALTQTQCADLGGSWTLQGSCDDCPEYCEGDTNHDGYVNMDDLLSMLGNWGACP